MRVGRVELFILITDDFQEVDDDAKVRILRGIAVSRRYHAHYSGHKPPAITDTPSGRYAGSLFTAASKSQALQSVLTDLTHLRDVIKESS